MTSKKKLDVSGLKKIIRFRKGSLLENASRVEVSAFFDVVQNLHTLACSSNLRLASAGMVIMQFMGDLTEPRSAPKTARKKVSRKK